MSAFSFNLRLHTTNGDVHVVSALLQVRVSCVTEGCGAKLQNMTNHYIYRL